MRYRYKLSMLIFGAILSSCSKENNSCLVEYDDSEYINFGISNVIVDSRNQKEALPEGVSQGSILLNSIVPESSFGVLGYCRAYRPGTQNIDYASGVSPWSYKRKYVFPEVFYNQKVDYDGTSCSYDYPGTTMPRRWFSDEDTDGNNDSEGYQYTFFSYYPYDSFDVLKPSNEKEASAPVFRFSMPFTTNDEVENQVLVQSKTPDVMLDAVYNVKKGDGKVKFNYSHVLTALSFTVNNYSNNMPLTIYKIVLKGEFWKTVEINLTQSSVSYDFNDSYKGQFVIYDNKTGMDIPFDDFEYKPAFADCNMLLVSGKKEGLGYLGNLKVGITYKFGTGEGEPRTEWYTRPETFTPRPGTKYQAQLNFVGNAFVLQFVNDNGDFWETGSDSDISFN